MIGTVHGIHSNSIQSGSTMHGIHSDTIAMATHQYGFAKAGKDDLGAVGVVAGQNLFDKVSGMGVDVRDPRVTVAPVAKPQLCAGLPIINLQGSQIVPHRNQGQVSAAQATRC